MVADAIRGMAARTALAQLAVMEKRAAAPMMKLLKSALANAQHNDGLDPENLRIAQVRVDEGIILKRWMPRAHGRATKILKRTSHIALVLEEIVEGKGRVTPLKEKVAAAQKKEGAEASQAVAKEVKSA